MLLFITTCCLAKLSLLAFLRSLTRVAIHRKLSIILGTSMVLWAVTSFVSGAFQCDLPRPWDHLRNKCFNRVSSVETLAFLHHSPPSLACMGMLRFDWEPRDRPWTHTPAPVHDPPSENLNRQEDCSPHGIHGSAKVDDSPLCPVVLNAYS